MREQRVKVRVEIGSEEQPDTESFEGGDGWKALVGPLARLMSAPQLEAGDEFGDLVGWAEVFVVPNKVESGVIKGKSGAPAGYMREFVVTARLEDRFVVGESPPLGAALDLCQGERGVAGPDDPMV
jgi:hypothetical protein